jgi:hypothetical protein
MKYRMQCRSKNGASDAKHTLCSTLRSFSIFQLGCSSAQSVKALTCILLLKISAINARFQITAFLLPPEYRQKFAYYENIFTVACEEQFIVF